MSLSVGKRTKSAGDFFFHCIIFAQFKSQYLFNFYKKNHAVLVGTVKKDTLFAKNYKSNKTRWHFPIKSAKTCNKNFLRLIVPLFKTCLCCFHALTSTFISVEALQERFSQRFNVANVIPDP